MKLYAFLLTALVATQAHAATRPFAMSCKHAGGYYGNVEAHTRNDGAIEIMAAQGYSYNISGELNWTGSRAMSQLTFAVSPSQCTFKPVAGNVLTCKADNVLIHAINSNSQPFEFQAYIEFNVTQIVELERVGHIVSLGVHPHNSFIIGRASHKFAGYTYETCNFRN